MEFAIQPPPRPKLHKICWLGSVFLSEGERKTPVLELLEHTDLLFIDGGKSPLKRKEGGRRQGKGSHPISPNPQIPCHGFLWGKKLGPCSKQAKYFRSVAVPKHTGVSTGTSCPPRASPSAIPAPLHSRSHIPGAGLDDPSKPGYSMKLNSN